MGDNTDLNDLKTFDYWKDMDLLIAYGFDFENGTWFEFLGFLEKIMNEKNALTKRMDYRSYKKPSNSKNAQKQQEEAMHSFNTNMKNKYSISKDAKQREKSLKETTSNMRLMATKK